MMLSIGDLTQLAPAEAALLRKHCELAGAIHRAVRLRSFLTDEVHQKHGVARRTRYRLDPALERPYRQILFGGRGFSAALVKGDPLSKRVSKGARAA